MWVRRIECSGRFRFYSHLGERPGLGLGLGIVLTRCRCRGKRTRREGSKGTAHGGGGMLLPRVPS